MKGSDLRRLPWLTLPAVVGLERFSYYTVRSLLLLYLLAPPGRGGVGMAAAEAGDLYRSFIRWSLLALLAGGLAGVALTARRTLAVGCLLLAAGAFGLMASAALVAPSLLLFALGHGLVWPSLYAVAGEGAGQDPRRLPLPLFYALYVAVSMGALLGPSMGGWVGERLGWSVGLGLGGAAALLALAVAFFLVLPGTAGREAVGGAGASRWAGVIGLGLAVGWFWVVIEVSTTWLQGLPGLGGTLVYEYRAAASIALAVCALGISLGMELAGRRPPALRLVAVGLLAAAAGLVLHTPLLAMSGAPGPPVVLGIGLLLVLAEVLLVPALAWVAVGFGRRLATLAVAVYLVLASSWDVSDRFTGPLAEEATTLRVLALAAVSAAAAAAVWWLALRLEPRPEPASPSGRRR